MAEKLSPWCKKAKIAMIQKDIGVSDMAERLGNNRSYISSVLNGRVVSPPIRKRHTDSQYIKHAKTFLGDATPFMDYIEKEKPQEPDSNGSADFDKYL